MTRETDYEAKIAFMQAFEKWRINNDRSYREIMRNLDLNSTATYNAWVDPITKGKPLITLANIVKMSKLSGVKFQSKFKDEQLNYKEVTILQKLYVSESEIIDLEAEVSNKSDLVVTHTENSHPYIYELKLKYLSREFKEQIISDIQKLYKIALKSELSQKRDEFAKLQKQYLKSIK